MIRGIVATLALGLWPRHGFARLRAKKEVGSHTTYSRECERVWGNEPSHPQGVPLWELESQWTSKFAEDDCRGQNSIAWDVSYIIKNILERRCLKWLASPIWTSETQVMAKRKVESQIVNLIPDH